MSARGDLLVLIERLGIEARDLTDVGDLAHLLLLVRRAVKALGRLEDDIEDALAAVMPGKTAEVEGVGMVEKKRGGRRRAWDSDGLLRLVLARARDERRVFDGGEYEDLGEAVARVLAECARMEWRTTPLRARNIDPDEWAEFVPARDSIVINVPEPKEGAAA